MIERQVQHMSLLLDDLLDISRVTRGTLELRMQMTDLTSIIASGHRDGAPLIEAKRHALKSKSRRARSIRRRPATGRSGAIESLTNAAKYTDPEGEIRLRAMCSADIVIQRRR